MFGGKRMQNWLKENLQVVWDKEVWPPRSRNYSLLDYFVWAFLSYRSMLSSQQNLIQNMKVLMCSLKRDIVVKAC